MLGITNATTSSFIRPISVGARINTAHIAKLKKLIWQFFTFIYIYLFFFFFISFHKIVSFSCVRSPYKSINYYGNGGGTCDISIESCLLHDRTVWWRHCRRSPFVRVSFLIIIITIFLSF